MFFALHGNLKYMFENNACFYGWLQEKTIRKFRNRKSERIHDLARRRKQESPYPDEMSPQCSCRGSAKWAVAKVFETKTGLSGAGRPFRLRAAFMPPFVRRVFLLGGGIFALVGNLGQDFFR